MCPTARSGLRRVVGELRTGRGHSERPVEDVPVEVLPRRARTWPPRPPRLPRSARSWCRRRTSERIERVVAKMLQHVAPVMANVLEQVPGVIRAARTGANTCRRSVTSLVIAGSDRREPRQLLDDRRIPADGVLPRPDARSTVAPTGFDNDASWNTVSGSTLVRGIVSRCVASLTPKPLAYTVFPPCTTATAMPGMPDFFIRSSTSPSSLAHRVGDGVLRQRHRRHCGGGCVSSVGAGAASAEGLLDGAAASGTGLGAAVEHTRPATRATASRLTGCGSNDLHTSTLAGQGRHHGSISAPPSRVDAHAGSWASTTRTPSLLGGGEESLDGF